MAGLSPLELASMNRTSFRTGRTSGLSNVSRCWPPNPYPNPEDSSNSALSHAAFAPMPQVHPPSRDLKLPAVPALPKARCSAFKQARKGVYCGYQPKPYHNRPINHEYPWVDLMVLSWLD